MKKCSLMVLVGIIALALVGCGDVQQNTEKSSQTPENQVAGQYAFASCNNYLQFAECVSAFSSLESDEEQMTVIMDAMKAERDTLSVEELQVRCDETWNLVVSTPELADHPQCWING